MVLSGSKVIPMTEARPSAERDSLKRPRGGGLEEGRNCAFKKHKGVSDLKGGATHQMKKQLIQRLLEGEQNSVIFSDLRERCSCENEKAWKM